MQTLQPIYESDSTIAMNTDFFLNPTDAKTMEQLKWDDIIYKYKYDDYYSQKGTTFTYNLNKLSVQLKVHYASQGEVFSEGLYMKPICQ